MVLISRRLLYLAAVTLAATAGAATAKDTAEAVHALTTSNFKPWTQENRLALVEFYAPWCGYCQMLAPAYEEAASQLKKDELPLAKVDCTKEDKVCDEMGVDSYPTLKVLRNGAFSSYNGTRQATSIVNYMRKHNSKPVPEIKITKFGKFTKANHVAVVGFLEQNDPVLSALETLAIELRDEAAFGFTPNKQAAKKLKLDRPSIALYRDHGEEIETYTGKMAKDELRRFVKSRSLPLMGELSSQTFPSYVRAGLPIGIVFYKGKQSRKEIEKELLPVSKRFRGTVSFAMADGSIYGRHATVLGLTHNWPQFAIQDVVAHKKYRLDDPQAATAKSVEKLAEAFSQNKAEPYYKSEPVPEYNDGGVLTLVSKQFNQIAMDKSKDVLLMVYAPWCIYSKMLAPAYQELGKLLKPNSGLVIAMMDGSVNDIPSCDPRLEIIGYPTIVLIRAGDNTVFTYGGDRSLESLTDFIQRYSQNPVSLPRDNEADDKHAPKTPGYMVVQGKQSGLTPKENRHVEL